MRDEARSHMLGGIMGSARKGGHGNGEGVGNGGG